MASSRGAPPRWTRPRAASWARCCPRCWPDESPDRRRQPLPAQAHFYIDAAFRAAIDIYRSRPSRPGARLTALPSLEDEPAPPAP
jgi:hypothetical protein